MSNMLSVSPDRREYTTALKFLAGFLLAVVLASEWMRFAGNVAVLWPANGILCAALFRVQDPRMRVALITLAWAGNAAISVLYGHASMAAMVIGAVNISEAYIAWRLIDRFCPQVFRFERVGELGKFSLIASIGAPAVPSMVAAAALHYSYGTSFLEMLSTWWVADALGLILIVPTLKLLLNRTQHRAFADTPRNVALYIAVLLAVTAAVFHQTSYPLLFVLFPCLTIVAFQLGPVWSAVATLLMSSVAFVFTTNGLGPASLIEAASLADRVQFVQFFITVAFLSTLPVAYILADQARLREQLRLTEIATREARDRAEAAARAKSEFLATMSHEIRTPLNSIIGYTRKAMLHPGLVPEAKGDMRIVDDAGRTLLAIVNDVLDYSALEAGRVKLELTPTRLDEVFSAACELMNVPAADKGIELSISIDRALHDCWGDLDAHRMRQVVINLVGNAIKHSEKGRVDVSVALMDKNDAELRLRLEVADSGPGIPHEALKNLFVRFSQLDSSRARKYGGTGLGLAICKSLVTAMGGEIGVESQPGAGSKFWFVIPVAVREQPSAVADAGRRSAQGGRKLRILVVDDLDLTRELTATVLATWGHLPETASSGAEAIRLIKAMEIYDAVLMDVQMPGIDGLAATREIRKLDVKGASVPIIAITANVLLEEIALCLEAGMDAHIGKPFEWRELIEKVHDVVERRSNDLRAAAG
jgi:signal transduction histidine kinase/ActR/RegA family two-component response regulator